MSYTAATAAARAAESRTAAAALTTITDTLEAAGVAAADWSTANLEARAIVSTLVNSSNHLAAMRAMEVWNLVGAADSVAGDIPAELVADAFPGIISRLREYIAGMPA